MQKTRLRSYSSQTLFLIFFSMNALSSCQPLNLPLISAVERKDLKEVRLGISKYHLLLPDDFYISEARGKEGQLGYNVIPKDTSSTMFGVIEVMPGNPIGDNLNNNANSKAFAQSFLADKKVPWKINKTETGDYEAFTSESDDLNAHVTSKVRAKIDTLISIIATLKRK